MKHLKPKLPKPLLAGVVSLTMLSGTASAVNPILTDTQLNAVLGVVTNFILDDTKNYKPPKKTGQTLSYNLIGETVIDASVKDDGFYQTGVITNYVRDDGNEIVTDNVTGLQWQDDVAVNTVTKPWLETINYQKCTGTAGEILDVEQCSDTAGDTAASYCTSLTLGGYSDWRLPTGKELVELSHYGQANPAIDSTFQNIASLLYWSSTTEKGNRYRAWYVFIGDGGHRTNNKSTIYSIRCVRRGELATLSNFVKKDNIVTDKITGLQWQDDAFATVGNWQLAIENCENLSLDGFNDWRLPNIRELSSLVDENSTNPAIYSTFSNTVPSNYWSSTTYAGGSARAWFVSFYSGSQYNGFLKNSNYYSRCVRAGH